MTQNPTPPHPSSILTKTELRVALFITEGYSTKEMAGFLMCSTKTIEKHRNAIHYKLKVGTAIDVIKWVLEHNLVNQQEWCKRRREVHHHGSHHSAKRNPVKLKLLKQNPASEPPHPQT